MLITAIDILDLLREEGLKLYLVTTALQQADNARGIPGARAESKRLLYGSFRPPAKMEGVDIPQGSSRQGELLVYFSAHNLQRADIAGKTIDYDGQRWMAQYVAEITHQGIKLMHLIKLVATTNVTKQQVV